MKTDYIFKHSVFATVTDALRFEMTMALGAGWGWALARYKVDRTKETTLPNGQPVKLFYVRKKHSRRTIILQSNWPGMESFVPITEL